MSTCKNGHEMVAALSGYPQYNCDICNSGARPDDVHFGCRVCNFDVCRNCLPVADGGVESVSRGIGRIYVAPTITPSKGSANHPPVVNAGPSHNYAYAPGGNFAAPQLHHVGAPQQPAYQQPSQQAYQAPPQQSYQAPPQQSYQAPPQQSYQAPPQAHYTPSAVQSQPPAGLVQGGGLGLVKPGTLKLEDTNVALIGSDMDKKLRQQAAATEVAWANAGKVPGLEIWRIEQFKVIAVPHEQYGSFYDGDSYIVLSTYKTADSPALKYDLHFWLGKNTTQDEAGTAAYKTVELDDHLGCTPVEHRQVQGFEDDLFLSYFNPIRILEGGVPTGFKHYTAPDWPKKLFWIQGASAKNVRVSEIPINVASLNSGDVFVLDFGMEIHQFNGRQASSFEKQKAGEMCRQFVSERNGRPRHLIGEEGDAEANNFLVLCGGTAGQAINPPIPQPPATRDINTRIYNFADLSVVAEGLAANRGQLKTHSAYVVDLGKEVYVWVGKQAAVGQHKLALQKAIEYLRKYNRPFTMPIHRVIEGHENEVFKATF